MEGYLHSPRQAHTRTSHLTKLYSDTKKSALTSINAYSTANEHFPALHRKFKIQKDRLITWGLAWSDDEKGSDGDIDDAVSKAGLTETVDSVLRNIKDVTEEAERIQQASIPQHILSHTVDKLATTPKAATFDQARFEDLLKDLTTSVDTLYDLSLSRRALARGEHPSFNPSPSGTTTTKVVPPSVRAQSIASSETTLINPPAFHRPSLSPYAGLPAQIAISALRLPTEGPPPYEALGVPSTIRLVAQLIRSKTSESVQNALGSSAAEVPVLVEYANFDSIYRDTHVPPPLQRLDALATYLQPMRPESQTNLSLLGYFEDPSQPRIGLVYDVPYSIQNRLQGTIETSAQTLTPVSLLKLVQKSSKSQASSGDVAIPSLECRFRLALGLTEQLYDLHMLEMSHGNVNSSSVIFTMTAGENPLRHGHLRSPLWAAFDLFSKCSVEGVKRNINLNIYKHPSDLPQGSDRSTRADFEYDLYGLALILLEVGLWTPIGDLYKPKYTLADFKLRIEKLWIPKLAAKCGTPYMRLVQTCFRMVDDIHLSSLTTYAVYDILLSKLKRCCMLDEDDESADPSAASPGPLSRQDSTSNELTRSHSIESSLPGMLSRISSDVVAASVPLVHTTRSSSGQAQLSRQPSTLSQMSRPRSLSHMKETVSQRITTNPSFKEYKRKVMLIQQQWRQHCARCQEARSGVRSTTATVRDDPGLALTEDPLAEQVARPKRQQYSGLELPQLAKLEWEQKYGYMLKKLCERALKDSSESSHISLTMYGEAPETARPTFLITCEKSTTKIKQILKRHFKYDASLYDVRVRKGDKIRRCRRSKRYGDSAAHRSMAPAGASNRAANPDYQQRPLCGASIGAYRDDEHLSPVSFGGIVLVDGTAYGMSVHHMLEAEDDDDEEAEDDVGAGASDDPDSDTSSIGNYDNISIYSHSDDESTVRPQSVLSADDDDDDDEDIATREGDVAGIRPDDYEEIAITQPALDDAIDCNLHVDVNEDDDGEEEEEDSGIDEDHLLSYRLGQVYASSGLKRSATSSQEGFKSISQSLPQEIDWVLFELAPPRVHPYNVIRGGWRYIDRPSTDDKAGTSTAADSYPTAIRPSSDLACAKVHCIGRTSGLASGTISSTMELVKIHGRSTFSASWTVDGDFGVGGDSGAWVIGNEDGRVCGHVLAAASGRKSRAGKTFICPMELLLEDIRVTLGAMEVSLPTKFTTRQRVKYKKRGDVAVEKVVEQALSTLRLSGGEFEASGGGGVALPSSGGGGVGRRSCLEKVRTTGLGVVETAG